jgi:integrase
MYTAPEAEDMARRRGKQKGYLREEGPSWIGYWWEEVRLHDSSLVWHRAQKKICPRERADDRGRKRTVTKKEAQRLFEETVLNGLEVRNLNPQSLATVEEFVKLKFEPQLAIRKRKGHEHYRNMLDNHVLPALGKKRLRDVNCDLVERLILSKLAPGAKSEGEGYSTQTVQHIRNTISTIFRKAKRIGWFSGDIPTEGIEMPEVVHEERVAFGKEQIKKLVAVLRSPIREVVIFLVLTGLRLGELEGLKWKRVNLTSEPLVCGGEDIPPFTILLRKSFERVSKKFSSNGKRGEYQTLKGKGNKRSGRNVPLLPLAVSTLKLVRERSKFTGPDDPVFASRNGTPIDLHNYLNQDVKPGKKRPELKPPFKYLKPALEFLGLPEASWHDMRHTANTWADQQKIPVTERKKVYGWTDDRMADHYSHADMERMRASMQGLDDGLIETENETVQ